MRDNPAYLGGFVEEAPTPRKPFSRNKKRTKHCNSKDAEQLPVRSVTTLWIPKMRISVVPARGAKSSLARSATLFVTDVKSLCVMRMIIVA